VCYLLNAQSIVNKIDELHHYLYNETCDCVFITETWLSSYVTNGLLDPYHRFTILRRDRTASRGGGVCAFVNNNISVVPLAIDSEYNDLEVVGFDFVNVIPTVRVIIAYRPPYYDSNAVLLCGKLVDFLTRYATGNNRRHVIVGDFSVLMIRFTLLFSTF